MTVFDGEVCYSITVEIELIARVLSDDFVYRRIDDLCVRWLA